MSALQQRKTCDVPTINLLLNSLNALVDSLTGLERILTTPIPFSFSVHLWTVTLLYCAALPFQLYKTLDWITIPGTAIAAFVFTGYVLFCQGETHILTSLIDSLLQEKVCKCLYCLYPAATNKFIEIENPFGFDRNDLNLDHFTHNIIRAELASITSVPVPDPAKWAFSADNSSLFSNDGKQKTLAPELWVKKGERGIRNQLARATSDQLHGEETNEKGTAKKSKKDKDQGEPPHQAEHPTGNAAHTVGVGGAAGGAAGDASSPTD